MTDTDIHQRLLEATVQLRKSAPHEWGHFLQALSASAEIDNQKLLQADPTNILRAQGRAVAMQELCINLAEAEARLVQIQRALSSGNRKPQGQSWP